MTRTELATALDSWREHDFAKDRELGDEVLRACGWKVELAPEFEGGFRWYFGPVSLAQGSRPHPLHDLGFAIRQMPRGWWLFDAHQKGPVLDWVFVITDGKICCSGRSPAASVALCAALVRAYEAGAEP